MTYQATCACFYARKMKHENGLRHSKILRYLKLKTMSTMPTMSTKMTKMTTSMKAKSKMPQLKRFAVVIWKASQPAQGFCATRIQIQIQVCALCTHILTRACAERVSAQTRVDKHNCMQPGAFERARSRLRREMVTNISKAAHYTYPHIHSY